MSEFASSVVKTYNETASSSLTLSDLSATTKAIVRAGQGTDAAAGLGAPFGTSRVVDGTLVVGVRPTEWVVLGPAEAVWAFTDAIDNTGHVSKIDFTHSRALFRLTGEDAPKVMEKICSIDWADAMMPDSAVVSASVAKVSCDIIRNDVDGTRSYFIMSDRSSAQYLFDAILDAGEEFKLGVTRA